MSRVDRTACSASAAALSGSAARTWLSELPPLRGLAPLALFLVAWQAIDPQRSPYFPPPSEWWVGIVALVRNGRLFPALGDTLATILYAMLLSGLAAGAVGLLVGISRRANRMLGPLLEFCRALPPPVIAPVAILLLGYDQSLKLLVVMWAAVWPILLNTATAASLVDPLLIEVSRTFRLKRARTIWRIIVPSVVPSFLLGVRVALPLAIIVTLLVEMLTLVPGAGALIVTAQREFRSAQVYGLFVLVGLLGFVLNNAFLVAETLVLSRWPPRAHETR